MPGIIQKRTPKMICALQEESSAVEENIVDTGLNQTDSGDQSILDSKVEEQELSETAQGKSSENILAPNECSTVDEDMPVNNKMPVDKNTNQTSQLPSDPKKADVHKLVAANLEKEDKELENLNKNLINIIGTIMAKVQVSAPPNTSAVVSSSSQELDPKSNNASSSKSIEPPTTTTDPFHSVPQVIDVIDFSSTCPNESYDDYHHLDPQDRPHYNVPEQQFVEYVAPAGFADTPSEIVSITGPAPVPFVQYSDYYHSQMSGQSIDTPYYQHLSDPQGTAPVDPYFGQGFAETQFQFNVPPPGYSAMVDADHSPDCYSDNEELSYVPRVGPCTPEEKSSVETEKKPFMTDEEIRLHRKQYFKNKRTEELKRALENRHLITLSSSTADKQKVDTSKVLQLKTKTHHPEHSRKDQKPSSSKSNHPKGQSRFMIPQRNNDSKGGKEAELNPTNPFSPNPTFFMKRKSSAASNSGIKTKPDSNKLDKHFFNELKSFVSSSHNPICDNSISSTTDKVGPNPIKKKKLELKQKDKSTDKKYLKNVIDSGKHEKKKETSSVILARRIISSDEENSVGDKNKPSKQKDDNRKLSEEMSRTEGSKSSFSQSNSSYLKDSTNASEINTSKQFPFVVDELSRKAIAYKCFVKLVNIFWHEKRSMTVEEMDEKLPRLVRKKLDVLKKCNESAAVQKLADLGGGCITPNKEDLSSGNQESSKLNSSLKKDNEIMVEDKQDQELDNIVKTIDDEAKDLPLQKDTAETQNSKKEISALSCENVEKRSSTSDTGNDPGEKENISKDTSEKPGTTHGEKPEISLKQEPKSTIDEIPQDPRKEDSCLVLERSNTLGNHQEETGKITDVTDSKSGSKNKKEYSSFSSIGIAPHNDKCALSSVEKKEKSAEKPHEKCSVDDSQKKRSRKDSLEHSEKKKKKRRISSGPTIDSNSEHKEKLPGKVIDKIDTSSDNDTSKYEEESSGYEVEDHFVDHDDSEDEEKLSEKPENNKNFDESAKTEEKPSDIEAENTLSDQKISKNVIQEEQHSLQEHKTSENNKDENAGNNRESQLLVSSLEVGTEANKKIPESIDERSDNMEYPSSFFENKILSSEKVITSLDKKCSMNCTVELIDIFWREKKSISYEKLQEILPTLIEKIMKKIDISNESQKVHEKNEGLQEENSDKKEPCTGKHDFKNNTTTLVTKGQKKYFKDADEKTQSAMFTVQKKRAGKESSKNLKKKSGISCEFIPTSSSEDDEKCNMPSVSAGAIQSLDIGTNKDSHKHHNQSGEHEMKKEKKKKKKKKSKEEKIYLSKIRSDSDDEISTSEKTGKSDNLMDKPFVASKSKKESELKHKEKKIKKREKKMKSKRMETKLSKKEKVHSSNISTVDKEEETAEKNVEKLDSFLDNSHVASASDKKNTLERRDNSDGNPRKKLPNLSASSHSQSEYSEVQKKKSGPFSKKEKIPSINPSSDNEGEDLILSEKKKVTEDILSTGSTFESQSNEEMVKSIAQQIFSIEDKTQIFSDSEEESTKDVESPTFGNTSSENQNTESINATVSNIIDSLSVDCPVKEGELQSKARPTSSSLQVHVSVTPELPIHHAEIGNITSLVKTSSPKDSSSVNEDPLMPSTGSVEIEIACGVSAQLAVVDKTHEFQSSDSSYVIQDPQLLSSSSVQDESAPVFPTHISEVNKSYVVAESGDHTQVTQDSLTPSSSGVGDESAPGAPTHLLEVDKSSESDDPTSVTQDPLLPSSGSENEIAPGVSSQLAVVNKPHVSKSSDSSSVIQDPLLLSSNSVRDESAPQFPTHISEVDKSSDVAENGDPTSLTHDSLMPSSSSVGDESAPEVLTCLPKSSDIAESGDPTSVTHSSLMLSSSSVGDESAPGASTHQVDKSPNVVESGDPASVTINPLMSSLSSVENEIVPEVPTHLTEVDEFSDVAESGNLPSVTKDHLLSSLSSAEGEPAPGVETDKFSDLAKYDDPTIDPLMPSLSSVENVIVPGVPIRLASVDKSSHDSQNVDPTSVTKDPLSSSSSSAENESTPGVQTHHVDVDKLSDAANDDPSSVTEDPLMPSSSSVEELVPRVSTCQTEVGNFSHVAGSDESSSVTVDLQLPSSSHVVDGSVPGMNSTHLKEADKSPHVAESSDQRLVSQVNLLPSLSIVEDKSEPRNETVPKDQLLEDKHLEALDENVQTESNVDEKLLAVNPLEVEETGKRRAPEGMQKDLAELDKKMEEIEKIVHNQLESTPPDLLAEQPSTTSNEIETNLSNRFKCILCKKSFCSDPDTGRINDNYSEKVSAFCKLCFENLYKERFDSWCKLMEKKHSNNYG